MARNNNDFINGAYTGESYGDTTKYVLGTGENVLGTQSGARVDITHPTTHYTTQGDYRPRRVVNDEGTDYVRNESGEPVLQSWEEFNKVKEGETIPMFHAEHTPPILDYMVATKDIANTKGMELAAHAAEETRRRFGERPWASSSTSAHSTPLTNTAIKHGLIKGVHGKEEGELAEQSNNLDWNSSIESLESARKTYADELNQTNGRRSSNFRPIDPNVMKADKVNIIGEALSRRGINPSRMTSKQFEQMSFLDENGKPLK